MTNAQTNLVTCDVSALIGAAVRAGIRLHTEPEPVFVYGERTEETDTIAAALNARREEVAATLRTARAASPLISAEERHYRREIMREPEMPVGELPWPVLKAMIVGVVYDTVQMIEAERAWEVSVALRDSQPTPPLAPQAIPQRGGRFSAREGRRA